MSEEGTGIDSTHRVLRVRSNGLQGCPHCPDHPSVDLGDQINHYLKHGYELLHVGSETTRADDGSLWHTTVATLGVGSGELADEIDAANGGTTLIIDPA